MHDSCLFRCIITIRTHKHVLELVLVNWGFENGVLG
jgi:hypothetical protein